ncbi:unnamed protein product [Closterium sp. NIES-65]|nr:unnamed protein product [Closterium sp. NIES-65]
MSTKRPRTGRCAAALLFLAAPPPRALRRSNPLACFSPLTRFRLRSVPRAWLRRRERRRRLDVPGVRQPRAPLHCTHAALSLRAPSPLAVRRPSTACSPSRSPPALPRPIVLSTPSIPLCVAALLFPLPSLPRQHAPSQAAAPMPGDPGAPMHAMHAMPPMQPLGAPYMPAMPPAHYAPYPPMPSPAPMYGAPAMPPPYDPSAHLAPPYMPQAMPHMPMPPAHAFAPYPMDAYRPMPPVSHPMPPPGMQQRQGEGADGRKRRGGPEGSGEGDWVCFKCGNTNFSFRTHCNMRKCNEPRPPAMPLPPTLYVHPAAPAPLPSHPPRESPAALRLSPCPPSPPLSPCSHHGFLSPPPPPCTSLSLSPHPTRRHITHLPSPHSLHLFIPILLTSCICPSNPSPPTPWPICPAWGRAGVQAAAPDGSWACSECGNVNYPFRSHCNRRHCGRPRPTHDTAAAAGSGGGDAAGAVKQEGHMLLLSGSSSLAVLSPPAQPWHQGAAWGNALL